MRAPVLCEFSGDGDHATFTPGSLQPSYFAVPASPQNDEPDHIAEEALARVPHLLELGVAQDATTFPIVARSRIAFERTALDVAMGRFRAPSEHRPECAECVKLFAGHDGKLAEFTLNRCIVKFIERASKFQPVKEAKSFRLGALAFAFVVLLDEDELSLVELDADFLLPDRSAEGDERAAARFSELEIRIMTQPNFGAIWLLEDDPGLSTLADTQAKSWRLPIHVEAGLQRLNGEICESKNWHDLARLSRGLRRITMPNYTRVESRKPL